MASKYRIIKLKSGETLICTLGEIKKKTIILERPMHFASHVVTDGAQLMGTEMLLMKNWIEFSPQSTVEIPLDHIAAVIRPDENIISCYDIEKRREDDPILKEEYRNAVRELAKMMPPPTNTKRSIKSKNEINKLPEVSLASIVIVAISPTAYEALSVETVYVPRPPLHAIVTGAVIAASEIALVWLIVTVVVADVDPHVNANTPS